MTKYENPSFTVAAGTGQTYRDNWEATFGKREAGPNACAASPDGDHLARLTSSGREYCQHCDADLPVTSPARPDEAAEMEGET